MIHLPSCAAAGAFQPDYIDPPTGENLGDLADINNPYMRRNHEFQWASTSGRPSSGRINFGGDPVPLATNVREVLPHYEPSLEPATEAPTSRGAADVRRGYPGTASSSP